MVAVGLDVEGGFDALPLSAKFWIGVDGEFVLGIFGLSLDNVFVGAFLNVAFVIGHSSADGFVRWLRQQFDEKTVTLVQAFSLFQSSHAILQHILDIKRPERWRDEHPVVKRSQLLSNGTVKIRGRCVITTKRILSPFRPVKSTGFEFCQVEIECCSHDSSVESSISRHLGKSKRREAWQGGATA